MSGSLGVVIFFGEHPEKALITNANNKTIDMVLVDFQGFPVADAKFVVAHMSVDWDEQAILYAKEYADGSSRANLVEEMTDYGFTKDQIDMALKEVGY